VISGLAESAGRRPAYFGQYATPLIHSEYSKSTNEYPEVCLSIYLVACVGLALQRSYPVLLVLRCIQSCGSSATLALSSAVVSDIATPAERGRYIGYVMGGTLLGPAVGPILGGILVQFLGWTSIFWFLTILAGLFLLIFGMFFPETGMYG
jgi:MFS family permease